MMVKDIMRKEFLSFQADDRLKHIVKTFAAKRVYSAPVLEDGELIGIVSESGLLKYFLPKKFLFWTKKELPLEKIKNIIAKDLAKKPRFKLRSEQKLNDVIMRVSRADSCIPVMDKKSLVGIVRKEDLVVKVLLEQFAKRAGQKALKGMKAKRGKMQTEVDNILKIVEEEGEVSAGSLAKELGITVKTVEALAESLERHHLIGVKYSWFGGMKLRRIEHE